MQTKLQRRIPAARVRHGKRLPQLADLIDRGGPNIPGPLTTTVTEVQPPPPSPPFPAITSTVTVFVSPIALGTSSPTLLATTPTPSAATLSTPTLSTTRSPTPSASASDNEVNNDTPAQSNTSVRHGLSTGSIVGIVLAIVFIVIAVIIFVMRKRSVRNRLRLRGKWAIRGPAAIPAFLPFESRERDSPASAFANSSGQNRGDTSPGVIFARAQARTLTYVTPPPPPPPQAYSTYSPYHPSASTNPIRGAGFMSVSRVPVPTAPSSPPPPSHATVKSTFTPTLPDELSISIGEAIRVLTEYDDGWALCSNARGDTGMAPLECLDRGVASSGQQQIRDHQHISRASSLAAASKHGRH